MTFRFAAAMAFLFLLMTAPLQAQRGDQRDAPGSVQIDPIPIDKIPPQPVLSPEEALRAFKIQPGFHIELVASEPLVHDPIALTFAPDGRVWVVEMSGYMPNVDGIGEDKPVGKVVILESSHNDGHLDKRVVFADHLVLPRAVALVGNGVLIGEPPHLWYYSIVDGDKPGSRREVAKDFGSDYNPQNTANGLMWSLDNWIYCASYTTRLRNTDGDWLRGPTTRRGEWGISQDDYGRLVYNSNEDQFRIDLVPSEYLQRNPNYHHALGLNVDPIHDQTVWPVHMTPGVNRGYWKGILRPDGTLAKTTAACGPLIYRGDNFPPEYRGNAFVCEPAGNLVIRDILTETNGAMTGHEAYKNEEFLASTDERFRPVSLYNGPDGALYLVDFHRGTLEHRLSVTTYLRRQIKARSLEQPLGLGRIYRITYGTNIPVRPAPRDSNSAQLVEKLGSPNGWIQDTAQRLLVERDNPSVVPALKAQALHSANPLTQIHTVWTLDGMGEVDTETVFSLLTNPQPKVRATAIRLSETFLRGPQSDEFFKHLIPIAENDLDSDVQLQLGFTFGQITRPEAWHGLRLVAENSASRPLVREAIISSLYQRELEFTEQLAPDWKDERPGRAALLEGLAECIVSSRSTNDIARLSEVAAVTVEWQQTAILDGMNAGTHAKSKKIYFTSEPKGLGQMRGHPNLAGRIEKLERLLTWPGQPGYVPPPFVPALTADEQRRYDLGHKLFNATCAACHQPTGFGAPGVAPPLRDSEWVLGSKERLARIVLQGVQGPIKAAGVSFDSTMPSWASFNDEQLAGILTYIRRDWEQGATAINPESVKAVRQATANRDSAWTEAELSKMP
ncbi:MAG TPA: c-type cytochrome [Verrucomicrobiae bacterium]|jgi:mono/diheme cytochrome c family protein/glucose/arabinose dehydrogenase|nr:c-type cytochrome [Verrucomicrobiae bacterium]